VSDSKAFIDWQQLNKFSIPEMVLGLTASDVATRRKSIQHLDQDIIKTHVLDGFGSDSNRIEQQHMQTLLLIVPLLIELLKYDYVPDKHLILSLLNETTRHYEYSLSFRETQPWRIEVAKKIIRLVAAGMPIYETQIDNFSSMDQVKEIKETLSEFDWL